MPTKRTAALLMIWSAALSGCALTGKVASQPAICPDPPKPPPEMMKTPDFELRARLLLFEQEPSATQGLGDGSNTQDR